MWQSTSHRPGLCYQQSQNNQEVQKTTLQPWVNSILQALFNQQLAILLQCVRSYWTQQMAPKAFKNGKSKAFFFSFFHDNEVQWVYISPLIFKHHTYQQFFITKRKKEFYNLTDNSCKHVKESAHCINKAEEGIAWSKLGNGAAHRHSPAMEICWGAQRDCCRPLLWGTLQKYQCHKNTRTVSDQRSLNPVSGPWQWPQMDTEGRERTRQAHMILPSLYSPYLQLFSGQGIFWARRGFAIFRFLNGFLLQVLLQLFIEPRESFGIHIFQQQFS